MWTLTNRLHDKKKKTPIQKCPQTNLQTHRIIYVDKFVVMVDASAAEILAWFP